MTQEYKQGKKKLIKMYCQACLTEYFRPKTAIGKTEECGVCGHQGALGEGPKPKKVIKKAKKK